MTCGAPGASGGGRAADDSPRPLPSNLDERISAASYLAPSHWAVALPGGPCLGLRSSMEAAFEGRALGGARSGRLVSRPGEHKAGHVARDVSRRLSWQGPWPGPRSALPDFSTVRLHIGRPPTPRRSRPGPPRSRWRRRTRRGLNRLGRAAVRVGTRADSRPAAASRRRRHAERQGSLRRGFPALLQLRPGDSLAASRAIIRAINGLAPMPDGRYATTDQG